MKKDSDDFAVELTMIFFGAACLLPILILWLTGIKLIAVIVCFIFFIAALICAAGREDPPSSRFGL